MAKKSKKSKPSRSKKKGKGRKSLKEKRRRKRVKTGIKGMDKLIDGGFENKSINLVVGGSGCGKTIFAMQYLMGGLKNGENCLFITFEENKDEFYKNMEEFNWDLKKYEKEGKFHFLEYSPEKVNSMIEEGGGEIENIVVSNNITRIVVDSITSFALLFEDELKKREAALSLFNIIRKWNVTSLLTLQENPSERSSKSSSLEFESDGIVLIYFTREKKKRERFIEILKMRGTNHSTNIHEVNLSGKLGFTVTNKTHSEGFKGN